MEDCKKKYIIKVNIPGSSGGGGSTIELPLSSDDVIYDSDTLTEFLDNIPLPPFTTDQVTYLGQNLTEVLAQLLYVPLEINSFTASQTLFEKGTVLTSIGLSWVYNKNVESQTITGTGVVSPTLTLLERSRTVTLSSVSTNTTITLTADDVLADALPALTATVNLTFAQGVFFGVAAQPGAVNSAFILSLTKEIRTNRNKTFTVTSGVGEYIWYFSPVAYGLPTVKTNGFSGGLDNLGTVSFTNSLGSTENYYILRSTNTNLGLTLVEIS